MFILEKFLFFLDLEVGAFVIGMLGFTTSFLLEIFIVMLLYQSECLGLFKLYACATIVSYYMFASFMLIREIFCDRKPSLVKHFLVIDIVASCIIISGNIKFYEFYPNWWPIFVTDSVIRIYSDFCIFSLLIKYKNNNSNEKTPQTTAADKSTPSLTATKTSRSSDEGVMRVFDNFCGFFPLELSGFVYCGVNFLCSVLVVVISLIFWELSDEDVIIVVIIFIVNTVMLMTLLVGIKMRKSKVFIPFLIFAFIEIFITIYLLISSMILIKSGEEYSERMHRFIEKINIPETAGIGIWIYFYLCICSLFDVIKCEENVKHQLNAKERITYGSVDDAKGSSNL